jgi:ubiquinone/menaquinone biosynthesis C-methylase UbiE
MRFDPAEWAAVHDRREARHFAFRRGVELCLERCGPHVRPGAVWADAGSGTGHLARALAARGARVTGFDLDPAMAHYAHRRWQQPFAVSAARALPLADGACSGIVAISLLGCLTGSADLAEFLAEAARVLAPGGTLCLSAMNRQSRLRPRSGSYIAYDPADLAAGLRKSGFLPAAQIFYGHFLAAGRLVLPHPETFLRLERDAEPGSRDPWARQLLLLARRDD